MPPKSHADGNSSLRERDACASCKLEATDEQRAPPWVQAAFGTSARFPAWCRSSEVLPLSIQRAGNTPVRGLRGHCLQRALAFPLFSFDSCSARALRYIFSRAKPFPFSRPRAFTTPLSLPLRGSHRAHTSHRAIDLGRGRPVRLRAAPPRARHLQIYD